MYHGDINLPDTIIGWLSELFEELSFSTYNKISFDINYNDDYIGSIRISTNQSREVDLITINPALWETENGNGIGSAVVVYSIETFSKDRLHKLATVIKQIMDAHDRFDEIERKIQERFKGTILEKNYERTIDSYEPARVWYSLYHPRSSNFCRIDKNA